MEIGGAADQLTAPIRLELLELAAIDHAGDDLAHVIGVFRIGLDDAGYFVGVVKRRPGRAGGGVTAALDIQPADNVAQLFQRRRFVLGQIV